jgi:predicted PurR-regulated permease PerM
MFAKRWRLVAIIGGVSMVLIVLYLLRWVLLPFLLSLILAYIFLPVVLWLEKRLPKNNNPHYRRAAAIAVIYIVSGTVASVLAFYVVNSLFHYVSNLLADLPQFYKDATIQIEKLIQPFSSTLPEEMITNIDVTIQSFIENAVGNLQKTILDIGSRLSSNFSSLVGLVAVPYVLFYMLKDHEKLKTSFYSALPASIKEHVRSIMAILGETLNAFVRTSLTMGLIVGSLDLIGLLILGVPMAPMLAVIGGFTEMIVMIGPWIGGIIAVIVTLALAPNKAIWVAVLFLGVQLIENNLIVPRVQAHYFKIHPILTIMLLIMGASVFGFWGLLLAVPIATTIIQIYRYARQVNRKSTPTDFLTEI